MGPLREAGAGGVTAAINDMTAKLAGAMARTASSDISHIDPALFGTRVPDGRHANRWSYPHIYAETFWLSTHMHAMSFWGKAPLPSKPLVEEVIPLFGENAAMLCEPGANEAAVDGL